ncbi:BMA-TBC-20 [Dirofilaria immitis]|nr:BMA-TBC-20 [Dirofilaria immitis]
MPSLIDSSTPFIVTKKITKVNENILRGAVNRTLQIKCNRMRAFIDENQDSLHLHISQLRQFASSTGGLVLDEIRALVWPVLASSLVQDSFSDQETTSTLSDSDFESAYSDFICEDDSSAIDSATILSSPTLEDLKSHREWNQVQMDVRRTLARFPPDISEKQRCILQEELTPLIAYYMMYIFKGFHDVCLTLLLVLGNEKAEHVGALLANNGIFKGYLLKTLEDTVLRDLDLMHVLLWKVDEELEKVVRGVELGSLFALSWPLTWFSHALHHYHQTIFNLRMFPPSQLRGPLMEDYRHLINISRIRKPSFPKTSLRNWLVAGTATAALYVLSKYMFITSSY